MSYKLVPFALMIALLAWSSAAFVQLNSGCCRRNAKLSFNLYSTTRRSFVENLIVSSSMVSIAVGGFSVSDALASGGATAGGVYLLSVR